MSEFIFVLSAFAGGVVAQNYVDVYGRVKKLVFPPPPPPPPPDPMREVLTNLAAAVNRLVDKP